MDGTVSERDVSAPVGDAFAHRIVGEVQRRVVGQEYMI